MIGEWIAKYVNNHDKSVHRALEILPGAFSWTLILFPLWGSFWVPHYVAYFVILFDIFWFYKSGTLAVTVVLSHIKIRAAERYSWMNDLKKLPDWKKIHHVVITSAITASVICPICGDPLAYEIAVVKK